MGEKIKKSDKKATNFIPEPAMTPNDHELLLINPEADFSHHHQCPHCSYHCERTDKLRTHLMTVHSEERPYPCNFCEKRFKLKDKLNMHVNTVHLKKKPFDCMYCNQVFGRKDAAKRHEKLWCPMRPRI